MIHDLPLQKWPGARQGGSSTSAVESRIEPAAPRLRVWTSDLLGRLPGLVHAMTLGDANMSLAGGPGREQAATPRRALCIALGLPFEKLTVARQVHGCEVLPVDPDMVGAGRASADDAVPHADGLSTNLAGQPLMGLSADCPLVLLFDPEAPALGLAHAGWRGTLPGIAGQLVTQMQSRFTAQPARMWAAIAPSAGPCCFEIQADVERLVRARWPEGAVGAPPLGGGGLTAVPARYLSRRDGRTYFDLWSVNSDQLVSAGVPRERIEVAGICTICDRCFCSFRRDGHATRFAGLIAGLV